MCPVIKFHPSFQLFARGAHCAPFFGSPRGCSGPRYSGCRRCLCCTPTPQNTNNGEGKGASDSPCSRLNLDQQSPRSITLLTCESRGPATQKHKLMSQGSRKREDLKPQATATLSERVFRVPPLLCCTPTTKYHQQYGTSCRVKNKDAARWRDASPLHTHTTSMHSSTRDE